MVSPGGDPPVGTWGCVTGCNANGTLEGSLKTTTETPMIETEAPPTGPGTRTDTPAPTATTTTSPTQTFPPHCLVPRRLAWTLGEGRGQCQIRS